MGKTQILSALGLALALGVLGSNYVFAEETSAQTAAAVEQSAGEANNLTTAINNAQKVLDDTKNVNYTEYPGVRKYLQGLVDKSNEPVQNTQALTEALNEGALAASLLMGTYNKADATADAVSYSDNVAVYAVESKAKSNTVDMPTEAAKLTNEVDLAEAKNETPAVELANTSVKVTVAAPTEPETQTVISELDEAAVENDNILNEENQEEIEVPKTGAEDAKGNLGVLVVAGVGVVAATLGATAVILKSRKHA